MLQQCNQLCKWTFLIACLIVVGYFILANEKTIKEKFVVGIDDPGKYYETIRTLIQTYLLRQPEQYELERYRALMKNPQDIDTVIDAIQKSQEYKELIAASTKTKDLATLTPYIQNSALGSQPISRIDQVVQSASLLQRTDMFRTIISAYDENLQRMPSMRELNYYSYRMLNDSTFDKAKLVLILQSSKEYSILQKNQTNIVQGQLPGVMTDIQITMEVRSIYEEVFQDMPDEHMETFLKYKFKVYGLDEKRFRDFLLLLKALDENKINISNLANSTRGVVTSESSLMMRDYNPYVLEESSPHIGAGTNNNPMNYNVYQSDNRVFNIINPSKEELDKLLTNIMQEDDNVHKFSCKKPRQYRDPLYETLKTEQQDQKTCEWNKNGFENQIESKYREQNRLAEYQQSRNFDELQSTCVRNTYYMNADDDLLPFKSSNKKHNGQWSVQPTHELPGQFGTPLWEAENTMVGSMLPRFIYKENCPSTKNK